MSTESLLVDFPSLAYGETPTGGTVRGGHTITRAAAANIVALGRPAHRVGPVQGQSAQTNTYVAGYTRSHDAIKQLWLAWYFHPDYTNTPATHSVELTITDALGNSVASSSALIPVGFKGAATSAVQASVPLDVTMVLGAEGYLDLDALAAVLVDPSWSFEFVHTASTPYIPLDRIEGWECPRSLVDSADTYGALTGPENPGNPIVAGTTTTPGYERIAKTIEGGIRCGRTLLSAVWPTDTSIAPGTSSATFTAFTRMLESGTTPWAWRVRPRVVYAPNSSTGTPHRVRYLYQNTGGGTGSVKCTATSVGAGSVQTATTSSLTSGSWAWSDWESLDVPTDGTDRVVTLTFTGKTTAGALYIASIEIEEHST